MGSNCAAHRQRPADSSCSEVLVVGTAVGTVAVVEIAGRIVFAVAGRLEAVVAVAVAVLLAVVSVGSVAWSV